MSCTLAAVPMRVWTSPDWTSTPTCAFMPKCHDAFLAWCISLSASSPCSWSKGSRDQRGINNGAFPKKQAFLGQVDVDRIKDGFGQLMRLQQAAEFEKCGGIGRGFAIEVNSNKATDSLAVIEAVFCPSSEKPKHCCTTYMRSIRSRPIGGRPQPPWGSRGQWYSPEPPKE